MENVLKIIIIILFKSRESVLYFHALHVQKFLKHYILGTM